MDSQEHDNDDDNEPLTVMLLWFKDYLADANAFAAGKSIKPIPLDHFLEEMLPELLENQTLLGINWSEGGECLELFPEEFLDILEGAGEEIDIEQDN
ncbi:DUF2750 domain-containing protein [Candidatus Bealeia paramacronuclearis]|uniref:DUF2750 domain-containing protein n=1 Tax=Candidatus Bealeia paramacronuclearis TaxID=1921001 RepID=A0ABZ2C4M0_9PROT|nr:hypothetical protein [Candidatus Bealeia paramacronuclearis]